MLLRIAVLYSLSRLIFAQNPSPCPDIFYYESRKDDEIDRWYGVITLNTDEELTGIWLHISLDTPAELLGNWFGEASSSDNKEFTIKSTNYQLLPSASLQVRFFVKYSTVGVIPSVVKIRMNGRNLCTAKAATTESSTLHLSHLKSTDNGDINLIHQSEMPLSNSGENRETKNHDDGFDDSTTPQDFFPGDYAQNRPTLKSTTKRTPASRIACGTVALKARPLLTHGETTVEGEWPWHAALYHSKGVDLTYTCGASLVSVKYIITAAHCVTKPHTTKSIDPENLLVYLGKYNLKRFSSAVQDILVSEIIVHPSYNSTNFHNDIAILQLLQEVQVTDFVRPICLWEENTNLNTITQRLGTVVGWGYDESGRPTENLMQSKMPVVPQATCIYSNPDFFSRFTSSKTFCAGFRNGTSACNGDSGGGMVFTKLGTSNKIWQLRGVVSVSVASQNEFLCDSSQYIVFTDVAKHLDWIRSVINS